MIRNIGDNASRNSVHNKNMTNSIKIDDETSREKNASIQKVSLTQCTSMLDNDKLHPKPNKLTVTTFESTALQNESLMTLSQHTKENRKTHQTAIVHTPNLNALTPERLNKNCVKTDDSFELALIPLSLCHSSNTPENLCLPQLSSNTSQIQLSTPHPVTVLNNKCSKHVTDEEHSGNTCCSPTQPVEYNNSLSAAPSSLVSSVMATSSDAQNYRSKKVETEYYHHLDSLTPTQSPTTTTAVTKTAVMTTLTASHSNKHIYNLDSRDMSNHASMSQNDHVITNEESVQPVDRALSNHSTFNDHRSNLLTSSECLSSSLENQKVDDFVANAITNNGNNNNNNMGSNSDFTNHRDFPLRSRSFFHLRRLDSPNSIGSNSTKPATDILSSPYDYSSSTNQLTVRVSSSPVSICRGDRHSHYHNYHRWQQQQQQHSCTSNTTNNSNNSSSAVKNKHGKCDKHISSGKSIGVRSYSAMRHPNGCDTRVFRSPLDVLAPCKGKLRVDIEYQCNSIKLHVIEAKGLRAANNQMCNSFVKVNVTPDKENSYEQISETIENSTTPYYNKEFSLDLNKIKYGRRIYFAIYVISHDKTESEFVGGMSFGIASIQNKKHISGWYYLLDEKMYRKKHLKTALDPAANNLENTLCANNEQLIAHTCHTTNTPSSEVISAKPTTPTSASVVSVGGSTINQEPIWWNYSNYQLPMNNELNKTVSNELHLVETSDTVHTNNNNSNNNNNNGNGVMNDSFCKQIHTVVTPANFMIYSQNLPNTTLSYPPVISSEINAYLSQISSPPVSTRVNMSIPNTNKALSNMRIFQFIIQKGSKGFGFTLCGNCPVYVSHVEPGSPAMKCGIQAGDFIVAIDNLNVSRSTSDSVVRMFRMSQHPVHITISRPVIMKSNLSTLNNAPSTSGKSLSSFINKSCFSALKKSSSESTKLTQLTNILNLNQTVSPPSPGNPQHHYYYQQHQPLQLEATSLSSTTTTQLQHCCPSIDQSAVRLSGCLTSPNLLRQVNSLNCSSSMSNIKNNCTTGEFTASQTTSPLHQTMTNKCFVRTDLNNLQTDLQLASTLSYPPLSSIPVYHFHQKQQQNPFHGQLQQQQRQQQQKKVNSPSKVTESETSCNDKAQNEQKSIGQSIQNREHLTDPKCLLQHNQHTDTMDKSELHQTHHFLPQNENLPGNTNLYNVSTVEQSGYPTPHHHHHHHLLHQHHHHPQQQQQMLMTMMMTATTTFPGINQYYYSNQSTGYLEHHGWLNLLDTCGWKKVELLLFPDLLLIAQKNSSGYFNVIKDPIYNTKISYINIPPYASDQLILQYLTEDNRKQIAHFQGSDVHEWLVRIQRHMVYNGNWWMGGK